MEWANALSLSHWSKRAGLCACAGTRDDSMHLAGAALVADFSCGQSLQFGADISHAARDDHAALAVGGMLMVAHVHHSEGGCSAGVVGPCRSHGGDGLGQHVGPCGAWMHGGAVAAGGGCGVNGLQTQHRTGKAVPQTRQGCGCHGVCGVPCCCWRNGWGAAQLGAEKGVLCDSHVKPFKSVGGWTQAGLQTKPHPSGPATRDMRPPPDGCG